MDAIIDFKKKQDTLGLFFKSLPTLPIGTSVDIKTKQKRTYDVAPYKFRKQYREKFDAIYNQAADYYLSCMVDEIELEEEIADNADKIGNIRLRISDRMKWPQIDPFKNQWLKSLLDANIVDKLEYNRACNHIGYCADTMKQNVGTMKAFLNKYTGQHKSEPQKLGKYPQELLDLFNNNTDLIDSLIDKSDDEIAELVMTWNYGNRIKNIGNRGMPTQYANALKTANLIRGSASGFRQNKVDNNSYKRFVRQRKNC